MRITLYDWKLSKDIQIADPPFYSLLAALVFKADTDNLAKLETAFPREVAEIKARYHAPGACLTIEEWEAEFGGETALANTDGIERMIEQAKAKAGVTW